MTTTPEQAGTRGENDGAPRGEAILDRLLEGCQVIGPDWTYLYVNDAVAAQGRRPKDELLGRTMMEAYPGIENTPMFRVLERCMKERAVERMENEFTFPDGSTGWFELRFEPVPEGVFILSLDVTARVRAEERLRRMNRGLRMLSAGNQALVRASAEMELMDHVCRVLVEAGEFPTAWVVLGGGDGPHRTVASAGLETATVDLALRVREGLDSEDDPVRTAIETGTLTMGSVTPSRAHAGPRAAPGVIGAFPLVCGGTRLGALAVHATTADAFGDAETALLGEMADDLAFGITTLRHRRATERVFEALRESEARYRALFDGASEGILVSDAASGRVRYANRAMCALLGYDEEELSLLSEAELHPSASRARVEAEFEAQARGEKPLAPEIPCLCKDGSIVYADVARATTVVDGRESNVAFFADATRRRELEAQFRQAQKLEAVGQLAGGVAHDFNNLLLVQMGYCDLMSLQLGPGHPLSEGLARIKGCAERAAALTSQLLAFSRKQTQRTEILDLNVVVDEVEGMLRRLIGEHIALQTRLPGDLGRVEADRGQIEQVILNMAVNARDAMPDGGRLTIETANVDLDPAYAQSHVDARAGPHVLLAVSDTGAGMDEETKRRIFEPFFTTKPKGKGTGLGLAAVHGIVRQSGGNVWVYSEIGRGTTFKVFLPRVDAPVRARARTEASATHGAGESVLLVEDEPALRDLMANMIEALGYRVRSAGTGEEALRVVEEEDLRPDLLVTDVVMPGIGGGELARRLQELLPALRVLYMSGYPDEAVVDQGLLDPDTPFLDKPFSIATLAAKLRELLDPGTRP